MLYLPGIESRTISTRSISVTPKLSFIMLLLYSYKEHAVAQSVEALRYKPEVRGFDSPWCHWKFSLT